MALPAYSPTAWVDDSAPDIDALHLNKLEAGVQAVTAEAITRLASAYTLKRVLHILVDGTYTPGADVRALFVECLGGGGGGGATEATNASTIAVGGGGGAAAYAAAWLIANIQGNHAVDIGAGGPGGAAGAANNGSPGADTTFGDSLGAVVVRAKAGLGGAGGAAGFPPRRSGVGGQGGLASGCLGDIAHDGGDGECGVGFAGGVGWNLQGALGGAAPVIGSAGTRRQNSIGQGIDAAANGGAGGSGACSANSSAAVLRGGDGASGIVRVWEYL